MNAYIVFFSWEGDNNVNYDSIWLDELAARNRRDEINELGAFINNVDYEPVKLGEAGYSDAELLEEE